jgi:phage-related tail protein
MTYMSDNLVKKLRNELNRAQSLLDLTRQAIVEKRTQIMHLQNTEQSQFEKYIRTKKLLGEVLKEQKMETK